MGQRAKRTVGCGVAVAAHNGHPRQGPALLRANDMHDALTHVGDGIIMDAKVLGVFVKRLDLNAAVFVFDAFGTVQRGGHVVVRHGDGFVWRANGTPCKAQPFKGLRAGYFMHQMAVDIQKAGAIVGLVGDMGIPYLVIERFGFGHGGLSLNAMRNVDSACGRAGGQALVQRGLTKKP